MIRMSRGAQFVRLWVAAAVMFSMVGCCGGGPSHKCDFSPAPTMHDGGSDAPVPCGTDVCQPPQVCCLKKSPLLALCIDIENFHRLQSYGGRQIGTFANFENTVLGTDIPVLFHVPASLPHKPDRTHVCRPAAARIEKTAVH